VVHEKFIGTKAREYARMAIRKYFETYFSRAEEPRRREAVQETL